MDIPGYDILEKLGEGGTAVVLRARQRSLNRIVALKILSREDFRNLEMVTRFRLEAESTAKLNHPGIVQVYDAGAYEEFPFLVMEYVDGLSIDGLLSRVSQIPPGKVIDVAMQVASAMQYAWDSMRLVHCDIKPGNILMTTRGQIKVSDLGVSRLLGRPAHHLDKDMITGTPYYCSPEQVRGDELSAASDIYSLGCTLYHMLTGQIPFQEFQDEEVLEKQGVETIPDLLDIDPTIPLELVWLVDKMLMWGRGDRVSDWQELLEDLQMVQAGHHPERLPEEAEGGGTLSRSPDRPLPPPPHLRHTISGARRQIVVPKKEIPGGSLSRAKEPSPLRRTVVGLLRILLLGALIYGAIFFVQYRKSSQSDLLQSDSTEMPPRTLVQSKEELMVDQVDSQMPSVPKPRVEHEERQPVLRSVAQPAEEVEMGDISWPGRSAYNQAAKQLRAAQQEYLLFRRDDDQDRLDTVEDIARQGLDILEDLQKKYPNHSKVDETLRKGYQIIFNARQSRHLDLSSPREKKASKRRSAPPLLVSTLENADTADIFGETKAASVVSYIPEPLALAENWNSKLNRSEGVSVDLVRVLKPYGSPREDHNPDQKISLAMGLTYLMPMDLVTKSLKIQPVARASLKSPVFPQQSFSIYVYEGSFEEGFDRLEVLADLKNQLVALQFVRVKMPGPARLPQSSFSDRWSVVDFINPSPVDSALRIAHRVRSADQAVVMDSEAIRSGQFQLDSSRRLILPQPIVDLLLLRNLDKVDDVWL